MSESNFQTLEKYDMKNLRILAERFDIKTSQNKEQLVEELHRKGVISEVTRRSILSSRKELLKTLRDLGYVGLSKKRKDELINIISKGIDRSIDIRKKIENLCNKEFIDNLRKNKRNMRNYIQSVYRELNQLNSDINRRVVIKVKGKFITLTRKSLRNLLNKLTSPFKEVTEESEDSWKWVEAVIKDRGDICKDLEFKIIQNKVNRDSDGGFFDRLNISPFDLSSFGILSRYKFCKYTDTFQYYTNKAMKQALDFFTSEHCIIHTLRKLGISEYKLDLVRNKINCNLSKSKLKDIAEILDIYIKLHQMDKDKHVVLNYGDSSKQTYDIALYNSHYFQYKKVSVSECISKKWKEYFNIEDKDKMELVGKYNRKRKEKYKQLRQIEGKYYKYGKNQKISSLRLIHNLYKTGGFISHGIFDKIPEFSLSKNREVSPKNLEYEAKLYQPVEKKDHSDNRAIYYADFETVTKKDGEIKAFMLGFANEDDEVKIYKDTSLDNKKLVEKMLKEITSDLFIDEKTKIIIYFHNLKFDKSFLDGLHITSKCKKSGQYYSINANYKKHQIEFRDSYKLIPSPLSKFGGMFGIECAKQTIPYKLYNLENITKESVKLEKAVDLLKIQVNNNQKIINEFLETTKKFTSGDEFKHMDYMTYYLKMDCKTLGQGIRKFNEKLEVITGLDGYNYLTISSLMYGYCIKNKVFENQYELTGSTRDWMSKAIFGGRVCTRYNKKHHIKTGVNTKSLVSDFDGVSLYASAIDRLCEVLGIPTGKPILLIKAELQAMNDVEYLKKIPYYIVDVKITKINKSQQIPFISYKNSENGCIYTNKVKKDHIFTVDKFTLEDWIKFHKIEYEIQDNGVKYTQFNKKFGKVIRDLFNARLECKRKMNDKENYTKEERDGFNAMQTIYKLMLNSAYGKTITKPTNYKYVCIPKRNMSDAKYEDKIQKYVIKNYNRIVSYTECENYTEFKMLESYSSSYNLCHIGISILSMSKRIMNEVMNTLTDLGKPCYYQDTDSMHILADDIEELSQEYKKIYGKELIGKKLGQFHNDFELDGAKNIYSNELIVLGKKCYMDVLQGEKDGEIITGEHIRMKGVNKAGFKSVRDRLETDKNIEIYKKLYNGEEIEFDLVYENSFSIKYDGDHKMTERKEFIRKLKF
jgi:hypothetical protein